MESNVEIKFNVDGETKVYFNDQLIDEIDNKDTYYYLIEEDSTITFKNNNQEAEIQVYKDENNIVELEYDSEGQLSAEYLEENDEEIEPYHMDFDDKIFMINTCKELRTLKDDILNTVNKCIKKNKTLTQKDASESS